MREGLAVECQPTAVRQSDEHAVSHGNYSGSRGVACSLFFSESLREWRRDGEKARSKDLSPLSPLVRRREYTFRLISPFSPLGLVAKCEPSNGLFEESVFDQAAGGVPR
jgi:hypothetical protein